MSLRYPKNPGHVDHSSILRRIAIITLFTFKRVIIPPAGGEKLKWFVRAKVKFSDHYVDILYSGRHY